jgi:hypothetical protein
MKREVLIFIFLFTVGKLVASDIQWSEGSLVLNNKEVLCGKISVEEKYDIVLLKSGERVEVYPAHSIRSVFYYDAAVNINRRYLVMETSKAPVSKFQLCEIVLPGNVTVVRHVKDISLKPYSDADDFYYYVKMENELIQLDKFRSKVYDRLLHEGGLVLSVFVSENRLDPNNSAHAIRIIEEYNKLIKSDHLMAKQ